MSKIRILLVGLLTAVLLSSVLVVSQAYAAVSVLDSATGLGDNNTNLIAPSAGTDRYWIICVQQRGNWATIPSTVIVAGTTTTTLDLIASDNTNLMNMAMYGVIDANFGTSPSTANGSLTYNADGTTPPSTNIVVSAIVLEGVDQTTPYVDTQEDGYDVESGAAASTSFPTATLDEVADGMGVICVGDDEDAGTFTLTDNGYAKNGDGPWLQGVNMSAEVGVKAVTSDATAATTTFTNSVSDDKGMVGIMLQPAGGGGGGSTIPPLQQYYQRLRTQAAELLELILEDDYATARAAL